MPSSQPIGTKPSTIALLTKLASQRAKLADETSLAPQATADTSAQDAVTQEMRAQGPQHQMDQPGLMARLSGLSTGQRVAAGAGVGALGIGAGMLLHHLLSRKAKTASEKTASLAVLMKVAATRTKLAGGSVLGELADGFDSFGRAGGQALDAAGNAITRTPVLKQLATAGPVAGIVATAIGRLGGRAAAGAPVSSTATRLGGAPVSSTATRLGGDSAEQGTPAPNVPSVAPPIKPVPGAAAMGVINRGADAVKGGIDAAGSKLGVPDKAMGVINRGADAVKGGIDAAGSWAGVHPMGAMGIAAGAGAVLAMLLSRKSKKDEPAPPAARYAPI